MDVFNSTDYKYFLREALHEKRRQVNASFTYERMARACGINKTYLSRVLNSEAAHLSEEQLYLAATYLGLDSEQQRVKAPIALEHSKQHREGVKTICCSKFG